MKLTPWKKGFLTEIEQQYDRSPMNTPSNYWTLEEFFAKNPKVAKKPCDQWAIAEIAGKDSIAAVVRALEQKDLTKVIGIGINHRGFFGNFREPVDHFRQLNDLFLQPSGVKSDFIYLNIETLFENVIIRPMTVVQKHFGYYSPCPACHFLFHMVRVPMAHHLGIRRIISGEREAHGAKLKLNQLPPLLDLFSQQIGEYGITLMQTLRKINADQEVYSLLGPKWVNAQPYCCTFSGNYYDEDNLLIASPEQILIQLTRFFIPLLTYVVEFIELKKKEPTREEIGLHIKKIILTLNED